MTKQGDTPNVFERMTQLEGDVRSLASVVGDVKRTQSEIGHKLDELIKTSAEREARRPVGWDKMLDVVGRVGSIAAMVGFLILYLAGNQASSTTTTAVIPLREDIAVMRYQIKELQEAQKARVARAAPTG